MVNKSKSLIREIAGIFLLSAFLAVTYNTFSAKGIQLIRVQPIKIPVSDSVLFGRSGEVKTTILDTINEQQPGNFAPLHERALKNPDSMAALFKTKDAGFKIISLQQVKRLLGEHRGLFIDARNAEDYRKGHIPGAWSVPALEEDQYFEKIVTIPQDTLIVMYCDGPDCHLGRMLIDFMSGLGFRNLMLYDDGWDGWEKAKLPVDTTRIK